MKKIALLMVGVGLLASSATHAVTVNATVYNFVNEHKLDKKIKYTWNTSFKYDDSNTTVGSMLDFIVTTAEQYLKDNGIVIKTLKLRDAAMIGRETTPTSQGLSVRVEASNMRSRNDSDPLPIKNYANVEFIIFFDQFTDQP